MPLSPDQRTSLSAAIPLLLFAQSWNERLAIIEQHEEALRSEEALGILAVIRSTYSNDRRFQERVDTVRMTINEAREDGYVGVPRPLSAYFEGIFKDGGLLAEVVQPVVPEDPPGDEHTVRLTLVSTAFLFARSWRERRHIYFGSRPYFESGEVVALLEEAAKANPGRNDVRL